MDPIDAPQVPLWEVGDVRCVLIRHDGDTAPFEIAIFQAGHILKNAVFLDHGAASDFAIGQLHARTKGL